VPNLTSDAAVTYYNEPTWTGNGTADFWNNTIIGGHRGVNIDGSSLAQIRNNIIEPSSGGFGMIIANASPAGTIDNNLIWAPNGSIAYVNGNTVSWSGWNALGYDKHGVNADPAFVNRTSNNFALGSGSPAVDHGATISSVVDDYIGTSRPQGGAYDIGAFEQAAASAPPQTPTPTVTPTADYTILLPGSPAAIVDTSGNKWTITPGGQVAVNGMPDATTADVCELAYVSDTIWQKNGGGLWWGETTPNAGWGPAGGTTTSPLPRPAKTESASGMAIFTGSTAAIVDAAGNAWTVTAGGQVAVNGVIDSMTAKVVELAYVKGIIWQENSANRWYSRSSPTAAWESRGTSKVPLPATTAPALPQATAATTLSVPSTVASTGVSQSDISVLTTSGDHMVFVSGTGDTIALMGGNETISDTGSGNTYLVPAAGKGYLTFTNNILQTTDTLDLRPALAGTQWNGSAATIDSYLHVTDTAHGAALSVSMTAKSSAVGIASFSGATTATLNTILAHSVA